MGSKKTTNVTNTGLGDAQYASLQSGQEQIGQGLQTVNSNTQAGFANVNSNMNQGFSGVNNNINTMGTNLGNQINQSSTNLGNQMTQLGTNFGTQLNTMGTNIGNQVDQLGTGLTSTMNQGFTQANNALNTIGSDVKSGFSDVRSGLTDTNANINNRFDQSNAINMAGFTGLNEAVGTGFAGQADYLKAMQANVLGGQNTIRDLVNTTGQRLDTYYGDLSQGQSDIQGQVGNLQTGFTAFDNQYDRDSALAKQNAADIQQGIVSSSEKIQNTIGRNANSADQNAARILSAVGGVAQDVGNTSQTVQTGFAGVQNAEQQQRQVFTNRINEVRSLLGSFGDQIDGGLRQQYQTIVDSFDTQGNLIQSAADQQGNTVVRQMDNTNNLIVRAFDRTGRSVGQQSLNLDRAFTMAEQFKQMAAPVQSAGFALPYNQTA